MSHLSDLQILQILQQQPDRLKRFLHLIPISQLHAVIQEQSQSADRRFIQSRRQFSYKKNVLDMNLDEVIKTCYREGIFNYFDQQLNLQKSRIQNHPQFGLRLVWKFPQKYYLGQRSRHYNCARRIEQAYGILRDQQNVGIYISGSDDQQPENNNVQQNEDIYRGSFINDESQQIQNPSNIQPDNGSANDQQNGENEQDQQSFIVDDSDQVIQEYDEIGQLEKRARQIKKNLRKRKLITKKRDDSEKKNLSERRTGHKLRKQSDDSNHKQEQQSLNLEKYEINEQDNGEKTTKKQEQIKKNTRESRYKTRSSGSRRNKTNMKEDEEDEVVLVKRNKSNNKMEIDFDD